MDHTESSIMVGLDACAAGMRCRPFAGNSRFHAGHHEDERRAEGKEDGLSYCGGDAQRQSFLFAFP
jgi:hypothetical protein